MDGPPSSGERPRLNLQRRTAPGGDDAAPSSESKPKANPFGGATAVDTASKFAAIDLRENEERDKAQKEKEEKEQEEAEQIVKEVDDNNNDAENTEKAEAADDAAKISYEGADDANDEKPEGMDGEKKDVDGEKSKEDGKDKRDRREKKLREPKVVNSRAALLGEASAPKKEELGQRRDRDNRDRRDRDRNREMGPPPVVNERFAKLAQEEKDKLRDREFRRRDNDDMGPPPQFTNSRFAAAAEADRSAPRENNIMNEERMDGRGPPPMPTNSRFAAAADADRADRMNRDRERSERGPPPVPQNSRFAAAAADYERENEQRERERSERRRMDGDDRSGDRRGNYGRDLGGPPPIPQNSRFSAAIDADSDYVPPEMRNQRSERGEDRFGGRGGSDRDGDQPREGRGFGGGGRYDRDRGGRYGDNRRDINEIELPRGPRSSVAAEENTLQPPTNSRVAEILGPKKPREEPVLPPVEAPLTLPGEDEEAAKARIEKKRREEEEKAALEKKKAEEAAAAKAAAEKEAAEKAAKAAAHETDLLNAFISGDKLGDALKQWCADQGELLPSVEKLILHLLTEKEQKNPDPGCGWAEPEKYGSALLSLVEDNAYAQMQVLWAIQKYCDTLGFPKLNDEYVVQSMFRAMYKYDLAEAGAFDEWKEDESKENSRGKMKAVIQTIDWFNWLEADDDEDDEEYEEEEE